MVLLCTIRIGRPSSANSRSQNVRARNPRSSAWRSTSITKASGSPVGMKIILPTLATVGDRARSSRADRHPEAELFVQPPRLLQVADTLDPQVSRARELLEV